jgi:DNA invertase Pin-like site-specific DNA recombinase
VLPHSDPGGSLRIGYARVSTDDQVLDSQHDALAAAGCEQVYDDVASGARDDRPGLEQAMKALRKGDVLVVYKLDRVGRSLPHLVELVAELERREVGFRVLTGQIDTTTAAGRLVFHIFAALAEFERELIRERTRAGLDAARARGRKGGRPAKMTPSKLRMAMALMADPRSVAQEVAAQLGVSTATLYRYVDGKGVATARAREMLQA